MMPSPQVVIHLDEREKAGLALTGVKNLLAGLDSVEVEVVAHSDGVEVLRTGSPHAALVGSSRAGGSGSLSGKTLSAPGTLPCRISPVMSRLSHPGSWNW
ncbi:hypothetical protein [Methanoculleus sp.]|uniref:hypothetical protein n=1 Tax=Methanoculleus sp. TaxID=90427 RepID=UPI002FC733F5